MILGFGYKKLLYSFIFSKQDDKIEKEGTIINIEEENDRLFLIVEALIDEKLQQIRIPYDEDKEKIKLGNSVFLQIDLSNYENSKIDWQKEILINQASKLKKAVDYPSLAMMIVGFILIIKGAGWL